MERLDEERAVSTYRTRLPKGIVADLTCPAGPLGIIADHVRDGQEYGQPGWTYFDNEALRTLRDLTPDNDGYFDGDAIWAGGTPYSVEVVD
jgi:hypothetical protein